ncbi:BZ3500_MvSof-1268-A1-R1_Chr11-1g03133 [Microbotryum saponariae]|uniref:BZ3500_MvSof-1268-A1-R1_Chr11-1g03133 protein n=1 Tax=Microbotryum saponariae TaxID=289078 RepID=A0A2X0LWA1_9BASI|nr:BZ3501_MvSof-1269-A2-R1_Chr11g02708 [Microbotryum saponariae]SDA03693.1 BZ3500_MvSof-1268-A1-R1_Chr11-1g03133 [Microbotryum saponariae]
MAATCVKDRLARQVRRGQGQVNRAKRSFTHVAAVDETKAKAGNSRDEGHLFRRLSALLATPIWEHAIGFTLQYNRLKFYVMAACGVFFTNSRTITKENGELSTFLYRLIKHSDRLNGVLATTTSLDDRHRTIVRPTRP